MPVSRRQIVVAVRRIIIIHPTNPAVRMSVCQSAGTHTSFSTDVGPIWVLTVQPPSFQYNIESVYFFYSNPVQYTPIRHFSFYPTKQADNRTWFIGVLFRRRQHYVTLRTLLAQNTHSILAMFYVSLMDSFTIMFYCCFQT